MEQQLYYREVDGDILPPDVADQPILYDQPDVEEVYYDEINEAPESAVYDAVRLDIRRASLLKASEMYARAARHEGLEDVAETTIGQKKLTKQYGERVDTVVEGSREKNTYTYDEERRAVALAIGVNPDAWVRGELPGSEEAIAQSALYEIRRAIGMRVGYKKRNKMIQRIQ